MTGSLALGRAAAIGILLAAAGRLSAQASFEVTDPSETLRPPSWNGLRVESASAYGSYYSTPNVAGTWSGQGPAAGASLTASWSSGRPDSGVVAEYTGSYLQNRAYSGFQALNHNLSVSYHRKLSSMWTFSSGFSLVATNITEYIFQPISSQLAAAKTADDLSAGLFLNSADEARMSVIPIATPILLSPALNALFGDRTLAASVELGASYRRQRWMFTLSGGVERIEGLPGVVADAAALPASDSANAGVNITYSFSPRTELGVSFTGQHTISGLYDTNTGTAVATFARKMSRRWFVESHGGGGMIGFKQSRQSFVDPQSIFGGGLGFKTATQGVLVSAEQNVSDIYAYGPSSNQRATAAWNWGRPGRHWSIQAGGGGQRVRVAGLQEVSAWLVNVGFTEVISPKIVASFTYAYDRTESLLGPEPGNRRLQAVRAALSWTPLATREQMHR